MDDELSKPLNALYKKNLCCFKAYTPYLYTEIKQYRPRKTFLKRDDDGFLNLYYQPKKRFIYPGCPKAMAESQLAAFFKNPPNPRTIIGHHDKDHYFYQSECFDFINKTYPESISHHKGRLDRPITMLLLNGCGLGYHIKAFYEQLDVRHLFIFEENQDIFYASLFTFDWSVLFERAKALGSSIHLFIGKRGDYIFSEVKKFLIFYGFFNIANMFIFEHMKNKQLDLLKAKMFELANGYGFFEDEKISIDHTLKNLQKKVPIFHKKEALSELPPAFVIGNGPSLDKQIDFIKKHQQQAIIFSAGTALGSLERAGIKPDFHIEMERTEITFHVLRDGTSKAFRDDIILLALNAVHPEVFNLFDTKGMALKIIDGGAELVDELLNKKLFRFWFSNPTVVNTAVNFVYAFGFKCVCLLGVDMGMGSNDAHHSQFSPHFDNANKTFKRLKPMHADLKVRGNLSNEVLSNNLLSFAADCLSSCFHSQAEVAVYNPNHGMYIAGAEPIVLDRLDDSISFEPIKNKSQIITQLYQHHFQHEKALQTVDRARLAPIFIDRTCALMDKMTFAPPPTDYQQLLERINQYQKGMTDLRLRYPVAFVLLRGSPQFFFLVYLSVCMSTRDESDFNARVALITRVLHDFFGHCRKWLDSI